MKALKINADYESVLFNNKKLTLVNEAIEFLAFYLVDEPILSTKKYSNEFLDHVERLTGKRPKVVTSGESVNWWGALKDIELEKRLNSKEMSAELDLKCGWTPGLKILTEKSKLPSLSKTYIAKNPYGMSGQNIHKIFPDQTKELEELLKKGNFILEPLLDRLQDFSLYVFPNGSRIWYQNLVDSRFQYKGSLFNNYTRPDLNSLSFYQNLGPKDWDDYLEAIEVIIDHYKEPSLGCGFSIDSFVYKEEGKLKVRYLSEVNYRRTMGQTAFELTLKFGGLKKWTLLLLSKSSGLDFSTLKEKLSPLEWSPEVSRGVVLLSPEGVRYDMFLLTAVDESEGKQLLEELKALLPDSEFSINI